MTIDGLVAAQPVEAPDRGDHETCMRVWLAVVRAACRGGRR
jgi:hypothetical protein